MKKGKFMLRINPRIRDLDYYENNELRKPIIKDFLGQLLLLNRDFVKIVPRQYNIDSIEIILSSDEISNRKKFYFGGCGLNIVFKNRYEFEIVEREARALQLKLVTLCKKILFIFQLLYKVMYKTSQFNKKALLFKLYVWMHFRIIKIILKTAIFHFTAFKSAFLR